MCYRRAELSCYPVLQSPELPHHHTPRDTLTLLSHTAFSKDAIHERKANWRTRLYGETSDHPASRQGLRYHRGFYPVETFCGGGSASNVMHGNVGDGADRPAPA